MAKQKARRVGTIEARGDNRWLVRLFLGRDANGKRKYAAKTVQGSRKDAEVALGGMIGEQDKGTFVAPSKQTLGEYLTKWLDGLRVSEGTMVSYKSRLTTDIIKPLGHRRLDRVTTADLKAHFRKLEEDGLGARSVAYSLVLLKTAMKEAVATHVLVRNPCDTVKPPKKAHREMAVWTEAQVSTFLGQTVGHPLWTLWHLLFATGLRPQEALALKWADLDLVRGANGVDGGKLRVQRALKTTLAYREYEIGSTKTKKGTRSVTLPQETLTVLTAHRKQQAREMLAGGADYHRDDFIFADEHGAFLDPVHVSRRWNAVVKKTGMPRIRLYDTRHTHATILLRACVNPKVVADRLGHASVVITLDTYSHVLPDTQEEVALKLDTLLFRRA